MIALPVARQGTEVTRALLIAMPRRKHATLPSRATLPGERDEKICATCGRPFTWRKKWARDWDSVRYCSDKCRMGRAAVQG